MHSISKYQRIFAVLGILLGMGSLSASWSSINMSLSSIQGDLNATVLDLQWMMNLYGITICAALLVVGKLGDAYGRKFFYLLGLAGLSIACLIAAFAQTILIVILCMGLFGLSAASVLSLSQALVVHHFPENQKSKAIALWATVTSISSSLGPMLAGVMLQYFGWRSIFFMNVPLVCISIVLVALFVNKERTYSRYCDWAGVILVSLIVTGAACGIMQGPYWGWSSFKIVTIFLLTFLFIIGFVIYEKKSKEPLFHPKLFANPNFLFSSICNGCLIGFVWAVFFFFPLYLQNQLEFSALESGAIMLLLTLPVATLSLLVGKLYEKVGAKILLVSGYLILAVAVFYQSFLTIYGSCLLIGCGWVLTWGPSASEALSSLPHKMAGMASGMFMTLQEIGGVIGLAISGVVFRMGMESFILPRKKFLEVDIPEHFDSYISDPLAAKKILEKNSCLLNLIHQGFDAGYNQMLLFLTFFMLLALIVALFIPKKTRVKE